MASTSQNAAIDRVAAALDVALSRQAAGHRLRSRPPGSAHAAAVLRGLPSQGWVARRDRALLVLSEFAAVPYRLIVELTRSDISFIDGGAVVSTPVGRGTLHMDGDDLLCGPCGLARWVHALDLTAVYPDAAVIASILSRAAPLTAESPHLCWSTVPIAEASSGLLFPPTDRWGCPRLTGPGDRDDADHYADELERRAGELEQLLDQPATTSQTRIKWKDKA